MKQKSCVSKGRKAALRTDAQLLRRIIELRNLGSGSAWLKLQ